jgi:hypothetical protein
VAVLNWWRRNWTWSPSCIVTSLSCRKPGTKRCQLWTHSGGLLSHW